jgi:hypothetical protein
VLRQWNKIWKESMSISYEGLSQQIADKELMTVLKTTITSGLPLDLAVEEKVNA